MAADLAAPDLAPVDLTPPPCGVDEQPRCIDGFGARFCATGFVYDSTTDRCHVCGEDGQRRCIDGFGARFCDAGFVFEVPQGAYYVLADYLPVFGDVQPYPAVLQMIERIGVNAVPGDLFFARPDGVRCMRFQFAVDWPVLEEAGRRLRTLAHGN